MLEAVIVIFSCAPTYFTYVFLILSLGLLRKNSFLISGCSGQILTRPGSSLFVSVERQVAGHSALVWSDRFFLAMELEGIMVLIGTIQI